MSAAPEVGGRPAVSVILPFAGEISAAEEAQARLLSLALQSGDEIIVVDNCGRPGIVPERPGVRVVRAWQQASSYYARNEGAALARNPWLLFLDSDCRPPIDLVDRYFARPIADEVGAVIGEVQGSPDQDALVSRYARSRGHLVQRTHWESRFRPWGVTANLLVRREAWSSVGGFQEGIRSGGDAEFSWRLQDAGWRLDYRPDAQVWHEHRDTLVRLAKQAARYGAGRAWLMHRYPQGHQRPVLTRQMLRMLAGIIVWSLVGQFERAAFKALDGLYVASEWLAFWLVSNAPPRTAPGRVPVGLVAKVFPERGAVAPGPGVHIEAQARPIRRDCNLSREADIAYLEDDGGADRVRAWLWLMRTSPRHALPPDPTVWRLGPAARRLRRCGVREIRPLTGQDGVAADAERLAEMLGVPVVRQSD